MKVVLLLAGRGRRMGSLTQENNKCLTKLLDKPLLGHLVDKFIFNGIDDIVPIVGYKGEGVLKYLNTEYNGRLKLTPVFNPKYEVTNNMYSLWCAKDILNSKSFLLCNGDLIVNKIIMNKLINSNHESAIMLDSMNKQKLIDSPGTIVKNGRIFDIGRHIPNSSNGGYAIGLYKFGGHLSTAYYMEVERMLKMNMYNSGFHDPLIPLLKSSSVYMESTDGLSWTDIDEKEDILKAQNILQKIMVEENDESV